MATFYSTIDKRGWVYQPNFVKWRHTFRGPRSSLRFNQEIGQFLYDLQVAEANANTNETTLEDTVDKVENGFSDDSLQAGWSIDATPTGETFSIVGLLDLAADIDSVRRRLENLERL